MWSAVSTKCHIKLWPYAVTHIGKRGEPVNTGCAFTNVLTGKAKYLIHADPVPSYTLNRIEGLTTRV